jgi:hypothetical protein
MTVALLALVRIYLSIIIARRTGLLPRCIQCLSTLIANLHRQIDALARPQEPIEALKIAVRLFKYYVVGGEGAGFGEDGSRPAV